MLIRRKRRWEIAESAATDERSFLSRRDFLGGLALGVGALAVAGCDSKSPFRGSDHEILATIPPRRPPFPFARNARFGLDRKLTDELVAARYNNFYEFSTEKDRIWQLTDRFATHPWQIEVAGLCAKPATFTVDDLLTKFPNEERLYRHRCVEAWAMAVPWSGVPLSRFLERVEPSFDAMYVRFISFNRPKEAPGIDSQPWYPWPYFEALRIDEAMNELAMLVTGVYGHALPKQHGAPVRLVVPWKYGYKSAKSIVRIELVSEQPRTFWSDLEPSEYDFLANVNPAVPHPRWSQASERLIGTLETRKTIEYNGYGAEVRALYE
ncbi:MAG: protein-methionine-sulfoxide reductase catalytic subunit MsrP [Thermoanaerobaculia bacterium]|nr:protein-methionine-sulfoxide reductase catalytic subunit MsrP [Thermoanaerobaculia bacterium]